MTILPFPQTVVVEQEADGPWIVSLRRRDGTMVVAFRDQEAEEAEEYAVYLREAVADEDPWVMRLLDVSAGKLRG